MAYPHLTQRAERARCDSPDCWAVYVDNNPIVMAHASALLASHPAGRTVYVQADLHDPEAILRHPPARETLDFGQPANSPISRSPAWNSFRPAWCRSRSGARRRSPA